MVLDSLDRKGLVTDAFDGAEAGQGDDGGDDDEADVVADFDLAKVDVELMRERVDSAFAGEHEHVGDTLTGDAQCDQGCADDSESDFTYSRFLRR